ncbi:hypothetical protein MMC25_005619 [Agyrium rufum]|nr:hypothetical protein [Agyrium rufum]
MAGPSHFTTSTVLLLVLALVLIQASPASAFGAGNIASISKIEGHNWRHGDIEDTLKTVAFLKGHKWTSMMIKRVYFGNWLRDYSQAVDVGTLKGVQLGTIRILVWILGFLSFGYATAEFEVTEERLGVYRPEEHIDNPKDYADNADARQYDPRLRPPVQAIELEVDQETGMKNYIANERLGIATSKGYIKHSFARSIHFGRMYTNGAGNTKGKEADLCEALRCLGQGLHCLEDFGAHTNYTELSLRELGYHNVFPHVGSATEIGVRGQTIFPLVTGTFGAVDFLHSVLGEATDHFAQTEIDEMDVALGDAHSQQASGGSGSRSFDGGSVGQTQYFTSLLSQVPGAGGLCGEAERLQAMSQAQEQAISGDQGDFYGSSREAQPGSSYQTNFAGPPGSVGGPPGPGIPGMSANFDPIETARKIYPILEFRDKVVKAISATIEKIPGLEALVEKITETLTLFVLSLLAPFIRPVIEACSKQLKAGSSTVVDASGKHQYEVWDNAHCSDPTHSLLSKDHFSNVLNEPAGEVAAAILQYVAPRVIYAWQNPDIVVDQVLNDVSLVFHHPALRDSHCEIHRTMFAIVEQWANQQPNRGAELNNVLSAEGVRQGKNHKGGGGNPHTHLAPGGNIVGQGSHSKVSGAPWEKLLKMKNNLSSGRARGLEDPQNMPGSMDMQETANTIASAYPGTDTMYDSGKPAGTWQDPNQAQGQWEDSAQTGRGYSQDQYGQQQYGQQGGYGNPGYQQGYAGNYGQQGQPDYQGGYQQNQYPYDPNAPPQGNQGPPSGDGGMYGSGYR